MPGILSVVTSLFKPVTALVDDLVHSGEERADAAQKAAELHASLVGLRIAFSEQVLTYETKIMEAQASIVKAEAQSKHAITSMWRPITMLTFVACYIYTLVAPAFDIPVPEPELQQTMLSLIKLGLGGYIIGRSAEKGISVAADAFKKAKGIEGG